MSTPPPIQENVASVDLSQRFRGTNTVTGSPALAAETVIATLTLTDALQVNSNIKLWGWCAFTVGTAGVSATLKLRQTGTSGTTLATTGALTVVAANLVSFSIMGVDASPTLPGQVYVMTLTIGSGGAASTVSAVDLRATIV
jgi:hypothetical protein